MIIENLKIYLQNFQKNRLLIKTLLETQKNFNMLFIQKSSWSVIWTIPSFSNKEEDKVIGTPNHLNWITFSRPNTDDHDYPRVVTYINIYLMTMYFSLRKDIFNHKDICCFSFFNNSSIFFIINIYSDNNHSALKYFKDTEANIHNVLIIAGNFNIRNSNWDSSYSFYSYSNILVEIADSFNLTLSSAIQQVSTWYSNNKNNFNLVIDLLFL